MVSLCEHSSYIGAETGARHMIAVGKMPSRNGFHSLLGVSGRLLGNYRANILKLTIGASIPRWSGKTVERSSCDAGHYQLHLESSPVLAEPRCRIALRCQPFGDGGNLEESGEKLRHFDLQRRRKRCTGRTVQVGRVATTKRVTDYQRYFREVSCWQVQPRAICGLNSASKRTRDHSAPHNERFRLFRRKS